MLSTLTGENAAWLNKVVDSAVRSAFEWRVDRDAESRRAGKSRLKTGNLVSWTSLGGKDKALTVKAA